MRQGPNYLIIGNGRMARHLRHYFSLLNISYTHWHRGQPRDLLMPLLAAATHVLVLISDDAIVSFIDEHRAQTSARWIHFSGALVTDRAVGAHPLMTFGPQLYTLEKYQAMPFVVDTGVVFSDLFPALSNPHVQLNPEQKPLYHALCVMAGNFSCLLWQKFFDDLERLGIPAALGQPYLQQQTENLIADYRTALTGPLARGDKATLDRNMHALAGDPFHDVYAQFIKTYAQMQEKKT